MVDLAARLPAPRQNLPLASREPGNYEAYELRSESPGSVGFFPSWNNLHAEAVSEGLCEHAVCLVIKHRGEYESEYAAIRSVVAKLGIVTAESAAQVGPSSRAPFRQWLKMSSPLRSVAVA
jgi:hypothetical protein